MLVSYANSRWEEKQDRLWRHCMASARGARVVLLVVTLLLVAGVLCQGIHFGEFHLNTDEALHAVTGLYFADLLADRHYSHPVQYTYEYYARYPALGLIHWPPLFHFTEGIAFSVFGPSVVTARLTVLLFALLGSYFWFRLVTLLHGEWSGAASTVLLAFLPLLLLYEKAVMLDIPSLALCIAASYFWIRYLEKGEGRLLYWFAVFASLALLTKQHAIYLVVFCLLSVLATDKWRFLVNWTTAKALGFCFLLAGPFYILAFAHHARTIAEDVFVGTAGSDHPYLYYFAKLPNSMGWPLLILSLLGIATSPWWEKRESLKIMLSWIAACYITITPLGQKEPRYAIYWLPALVYFAVGPWVSLLRRPRLRLVGATVLLLLLANQTVLAWSYRRPYLSGYKAVANWVVRNDCSGVILFDGDLFADFIFYLRVYDPAKQFVVLRKALYAKRIYKEYGSAELLHNEQDLQQLVDDYGIKCVIVETGMPLKFSVQETLRHMVQGPEFKLAETFPLDTNDPEFEGRRVLVYENKAPKPLTATVVHLRMLTLSRDIVVPVESLLGARTRSR